MKVTAGKLAGIFIIEPKLFEDGRGFFFESYNAGQVSEYGMALNYVQDNHSRSVKNTLRGLHYQINPGQDKLVRVIQGEIFDVAVDIRQDSPTSGQWEGFILSAENRRQVFIPKGFAHGFCVLSDIAEFLYKCSGYYAPADERGIAWDDPDLKIDWPISQPVLSERDQNHPGFKDMERYF